MGIENPRNVRKAVIAAAGFGTRFLPQTKAMPKEMLPLIDKPIIQYVVEELVGAGVEDIIIVTNSSKRSIEDHFDVPAGDLIANLKLGGADKEPYIGQIEAIADLANFIYVRQKGPYGNATPILNAQHLIGDEPFFYVFADDLYVATPTRYQQMVAMFERFQAPVVPCVTVKDDAEFERYGIVAGDEIEPGVLRMRTIIEKPGREAAPSHLAANAGYIFTPDIFQHLEAQQTKVMEGAELQLQPAVNELIASGRDCYAFELQNARYYDTGNKLEYLKTVIDFGLADDNLGGPLREHLKSLLS